MAYGITYWAMVHGNGKAWVVDGLVGVGLVAGAVSSCNRLVPQSKAASSNRQPSRHNTDGNAAFKSSKADIAFQSSRPPAAERTDNSGGMQARGDAKEVRR